MTTAARSLLGTNRLLLDSPVATDPRMRQLLEDLELVLAQIAQLSAEGRAFVVATVIESAGSTPQKPGSKMVVLPDGSLRAVSANRRPVPRRPVSPGA